MSNDKKRSTRFWAAIATALVAFGATQFFTVHDSPFYVPCLLVFASSIAYAFVQTL